MSEPEKGAKKEVVKLFTKENILTTATEEEYEDGEFKFMSVGGQEIGRIKVAEYRKLEKMPFKEPLTYIFQLFNCLRVGFNVLSKILLLLPICYFWLMMAVVIFGDVALKTTLSVADLYSPALLQISLLMAVTPIFIGGLLFNKIGGWGYIDTFKKRFHCLLNKRIPTLKLFEEYKLEWVNDQYGESLPRETTDR